MIQRNTPQEWINLKHRALQAEAKARVWKQLAKSLYADLKAAHNELDELEQELEGK